MEDNKIKHNSLAFEIIKEEKNIIQKLHIILLTENILLLILCILLSKILL